MVAMIGWQDTSAEEQRQAREVMRLFAQQDSRDELGIGQVRDVLADALFPGTSVLLTRARYYLIIPWAYAYQARRGYSGPALAERAAKSERKLIATLRDSGDTDGLIGRMRGPGVKVLPSAIYWNGLRRYGILLRDVQPDGLAAYRRSPDVDVDELASRVVGDWSPTIPPAPEGFPGVLEGGLDLSFEEAAWLREQILAATPGTLLSHLLRADAAPDPASSAPWADPVARSAVGEVSEVLNRAELFSLAMHGAAFIYNFHLARRYNQLGYTAAGDRTDFYQEAFENWLLQIDAAGTRLAAWDSDEFWTFVCTRNPRVGPATRAFVSNWFAQVKQGRVSNGVDDDELRRLVCQREKSVKKGQSRLTNDRLMARWEGASGSRRLVYRWPNVARIATDLHEGRAHDAGA